MTSTSCFLNAIDNPIRAVDYLSNVRTPELVDNSPGSWEGCELIASLEYPVYDAMRELFWVG